MTTRIYLPLLSSGTISLPSAQAQHVRVLRLQVGDMITLFDGCGSVAESLITAISKKSIEVNVSTLAKSSLPSTHSVHLFQALIRNDKMDLIIQKAVELGAKSITPVICERTQGRLSTAKIHQKMQHWNEIITNSAEQSGLNFLPALHSVLAFAEVGAAVKASHAMPLILSPTASLTFSHVGGREKESALIIGPEGGFTELELSMAAQEGFQFIRVHENILRAETAAIVALSLCQFCCRP